MSGKWIETSSVPRGLGLGSTPRFAFGRWYAKSGERPVTYSGLGDANSDMAAGDAAKSQADTEFANATTASDYQQAIGDWLTAMNDYRAVLSDSGQDTSPIDNLISGAQSAQTIANGTTDSSTASSQASLVQVSANTARSIAQNINSSNKKQQGTTTTTTTTTPTSTTTTTKTPSPSPTPAITTVTPASKTTWLPWALAGGAVLGVGAIAYAAHRRKKRRGR